MTATAEVVAACRKALIRESNGAGALLASLPTVDLTTSGRLTGTSDATVVDGAAALQTLRSQTLWADALLVVGVSETPHGLGCEMWRIGGREVTAFSVVHAQGAWRVDRFSLDASPDGVGVAFDDGYPPEDAEETAEALILNAVALVDGLASIAASDLYAVEQRPRLSAAEGAREAKSLKRKPWATTARRVIFIRPGEARSYTPHEAVEASTHTTAAHHRRGHWRTLRHEKYGEKQGVKVWVRAAWIGPREWIKDGSEYRVLGPEAPA